MTDLDRVWEMLHHRTPSKNNPMKPEMERMFLVVDDALSALTRTLRDQDIDPAKTRLEDEINEYLEYGFVDLDIDHS